MFFLNLLPVSATQAQASQDARAGGHLRLIRVRSRRSWRGLVYWQGVAVHLQDLMFALINDVER
jgi:hypothetical protein